MLSFDLQKLESIDGAHGVSADELQKEANGIPELLKKIDARGQGFYSIVDDESTVEEVEKYAKEVQGKYEHIVVLGIGGSALGTICLQQSLGHLFKPGKPQLHVIDNIDPVLLKELDEVINLSSTLFIVVSKSGGTPEALAMYFYHRQQVEDAGLDIKDHFLFITDPEKGVLRKVANEENIKAFSVPPNVGGRFSVLTPVGLVPAALIGINIRELMSGARGMRDNFLSHENNYCYQLARAQYVLAQKGKIMTVIMPYAQKLIRLADWYRQLLAESIGKAKNDAGETVNTGLTPVNALGVTDQHSQSQLYNEGPNDKLFIFINVQNLGHDMEIPMLMPNEETVSFLNGATFTQLLHKECEATRDALLKNDRPNITINLEKINESSLGELFMLFEGSIAFLGEMFGINAFDQPGVELAKILTKEYLGEKH